MTGFTGRIWVVALSIVGLGACCSAPAVSGGDTPRPRIDGGSASCDAPPRRACCKALTPECMTCAEEGRLELERWQARCGAENEGRETTSQCSGPIDFVAMSSEDAHVWRADCKSSFDCTQPLPPKACCLAMTPTCLACADEGRQQKAAFDFACFGETSPVQEHFDCAAPAPLTPCCKALTPKCMDCVAKNKFIDEAYQRQCGKP